KEVNQLFSERAFRADPKGDAESYGNADRSILLVGEAQLAKTWRIYVEYDYTARYSNVIVDSNVRFHKSAEEALDLTEHAFSVGGMYVVYSGRFYRLKLHGGLGGVIA